MDRFKLSPSSLTLAVCGPVQSGHPVGLDRTEPYFRLGSSGLVESLPFPPPPHKWALPPREPFLRQYLVRPNQFGCFAQRYCCYQRMWSLPAFRPLLVNLLNRSRLLFWLFPGRVVFRLRLKVPDGAAKNQYSHQLWYRWWVSIFGKWY